MGFLILFKRPTMLFESLTTPSLIRRLNANDNPSQMALVEKLSTLNLQLLEELAQQPRFETFVQDEFDRHFSDLMPRLDVRKDYVQGGEEQAFGQTTLQDTLAPSPLAPTVLDVVVQRIVTGQASTHASRDTRFYRTPADEGDPPLIPELNGLAFDGFVDSLGGALTSRYLTFTQTYWAMPRGSTDVRSRRQWLVDKRLEHLRTEVALLKGDGLVTAAGEALFDKLLRYPDALARRALKGYKPCAYGLALKGAASADALLHGAFVLTARDPQDAQNTWESDTPAELQVRPVNAGSNLGIVLLFSPNNGLEEFDSLASLDRELHRRLNHPSEFSSLLALMADNDQPQGLALHREDKTSDQFTYLEWLDSPFIHAIEDQCQKLRADFISTLMRYQAFPATQDRSRLAESLDLATDLTRAFDGSPVLLARLKKRGQAQLKIFLEGASAADKLAWHEAIQGYCDELSNLSDTEGLPTLAQFSDKTALLAYGNAQLRGLLKAQFGLQANPDEILVHTREPHTPPIVYVPGAASSVPREPGTPLYTERKRSLTELALENVGGLDFNFANFSRLTDKSGAVYSDLTVGQVKDLVRSANIGDSYDALLKDRLITSPAALAQKSHFARVIERQVRLDAIEAKIAGDFLPDRLERGFNWVRVVLDQPVDSDRRETVEGHRVVVQSLKLRGQRVRGVWLFRSASSSVGSTVVYAPQAPGGRVFYEFADDQLSSGFTHNSSWREYLVGRVEKAQQRHVRSILRGRGDMTMMHMPRIAGNIFEEAYEVEANFAINDAGSQSRTTTETDVDTAITVATTAFDIAAMVLPIKVMLPIGLARSLFSIFNAMDAASLGDRGEAAHHLVRALGEFIGALVDGAVGARTGAATAASRGLNPHMALRSKPADLLVLKGWEGKGIYYKVSTVEGTRQYFLRAQNRWFSILDEGGEQAWRVRDVRKPYQYHHAPIRVDSQGRWEVGSHPGKGLKGGLSPEEELRQLYPFLSQDNARLVFESFNFPPGRELEFQLDVVHTLRAGTALDAFNQYLMVTPRRLSLRLRGGDSSGTPLTPLEPLPGLSQARPVRQPLERFVDWGQTIDAAELQLHNADLGIYRRIGGTAALIGTDYVKIDQRYFPILPSGASATVGEVPRHFVFMRDPNQPFRTYGQFETMLRRDLFDQPRIASFAPQDRRWVNATTMSFQKPLTASVAQAFPMLTIDSQVNVARTLFNRANPNGLTAWGITAMQRTLQDWRLASPSSHVRLGDPLTLLPTTVRTAQGHWRLVTQPHLYTRLTFRTDHTPILLYNALVSRTDGTLKALMNQVLIRDGYIVMSAYSPPGEVLFKRPARDTLYWLRLRRVFGEVVESGPNVTLRETLLDAASRRQVNAARAAGKLVSLVGGIHVPFEGSAAAIFVLRV
ncbi:DUF6543 domain-containing protein [Pseudomonas sp. lyk4-R2A-8]|uniref:dermonecrotic toxin domain-containing protein n=1 Tax=Pseudomonas sp. lyk4-R2A-8 TaxID=3040316 RepID=UPI002557A848|nr:DUF6543 domain-containing protein [Pseudomonas sp. lyk4-R2A-8]